MNKPVEFDASVLTQLKGLLGERVSTSAAVREHHGKDESYFPYAPPDAVAFVESTEEVRDVVNICRRHRVPMIPYGVGTSLVTGSGHPTCGFVYKLVARTDDSGAMVSVAKKSKDKISIGGRKYALRRRDPKGCAQAEMVGVGHHDRSSCTACVDGRMVESSAVGIVAIQQRCSGESHLRPLAVHQAGCEQGHQRAARGGAGHP